MKYLLLMALLFSVNSLHAQETTVKASDVKEDVKQLPAEDDIDKEITDSKMRADSGSKSKFSGSVSFTYNGASLEKPFSNERPNVDGGIAEPVQLSGTMGVRYRIDKNQSMYVSTGISKDRPFDNQAEDKWEAKNPTLMYGNWFRYRDIQMSTSLMAYFYTEDFYSDLNYVTTLAGSLGTLLPIGKSRVNFGLTTYFSQTFFDGSKTQFTDSATNTKITVDARPMQYENFIDLRPMLQYRFNDYFNVYTSVGLATFFRTRADDRFDYEKADITQTLGAGIAVARDFYLAPNIDFRPEDIRADNTSVNLSAVINVL